MNKERADVGVDNVYGGPYTVVTLKAKVGDEEFKFYGDASCHPSDEYVKEIGVQLALGRALEQAGKRLQRRAEGLVKHQEDVRKDQFQKEVRKIVRNELAKAERQAHPVQSLSFSLPFTYSSPAGTFEESDNG